MRRVRAVRRGLLEPGGAPAGRDDPGGAEQLRGLHGDEADRARGAEHEHVLAAAERRAPRERQPAGEPRDPERGGERGIRAVGHLDRVRVPDRGALGDRAVRRPPQRAAEDPDDPAVRRATDRLAARDVRQLGMAGREDPARHREVDRVDRSREHVDRVAGRLGRVAHLGRRADVTDESCAHAATLRERKEEDLARNARDLHLTA